MQNLNLAKFSTIQYKLLEVVLHTYMHNLILVLLEKPSAGPVQGVCGKGTDDLQQWSLPFTAPVMDYCGICQISISNL